MSYAIIGFGKIGHALAKAFARKGHRSVRGNDARPEKLRGGCGRDRNDDHSETLAEAVKADVHLLGRSFRSAPGCREGAAQLAGEGRSSM